MCCNVITFYSLCLSDKKVVTTKYFKLQATDSVTM